jgi:hypothetical protein
VAHEEDMVLAAMKGMVEANIRSLSFKELLSNADLILLLHNFDWSLWRDKLSLLPKRDFETSFIWQGDSFFMFSPFSLPGKT